MLCSVSANRRSRDIGGDGVVDKAGWIADMLPGVFPPLIVTTDPLPGDVINYFHVS